MPSSKTSFPPQPADSPRRAVSAGIALHDARPLFEKALQYGLQHGLFSADKLSAMAQEAPKGIVQIARHFGSEHLRPELEKAKDRMINLVSLCLHQASDGDLRLAAESLRDHSLLSRSKGGADLLKALLALPESSHFDGTDDGELDTSPGPSPQFAQWTLRSWPDYQAERALREPHQAMKDAALWMAERLGLSEEELQEAHIHAEAVIRTALLAEAAGSEEFPDWTALEQLLMGWREDVATGTTKAKKITPAALKKAAAARADLIHLPQELPEAWLLLVQQVRDSLLADLPLLLDARQSVRTLLRKEDDEHMPPLFSRYFWHEDLASEVSQHDAEVSDAWDAALGGHSDEGSLLTLLLCVASGAPRTTLLTEKAATSLVRKLQKPSATPVFQPERASQFLREHAPQMYQDDYLQLWQDFVDESQATLCSDAVYAESDALALLRRECHVKVR